MSKKNASEDEPLDENSENKDLQNIQDNKDPSHDIHEEEKDTAFCDPINVLLDDCREAQEEIDIELSGSAQSNDLRDLLFPGVIGPYKILKTLGEGAFGKVFLAERSKPSYKLLALKLIKVGMDTKDVLKRFDFDRQALAIMNHSNIAKVYDAGHTEQGRPYFTMEFVSGEHITDFCDHHNLDIRARLELFIQICNGIHHAHQKGIIHRDIKPSNILVHFEENRIVPKVIDFGIAKATDKCRIELTMLEETGQIIGTLGYMGPERLSSDGHEIDIRTDVYSLGILLFELLLGKQPLDLEKKTGAEAYNILPKNDPQPPPEALRRLGENLDEVAKERKTDVKSLRKIFHGDLTAILHKALQKKPEDRYESVWHLKEDVENYLQNKRVMASAPGFLYFSRKFIQRHKAIALVSLGVVILGLLFFTVNSINHHREVTKAIGEAEEALKVFYDEFSDIDEMSISKDIRKPLDLIREKLIVLEAQFPGNPTALRIRDEMLNKLRPLAKATFKRYEKTKEDQENAYNDWKKNRDPQKPIWELEKELSLRLNVKQLQRKINDYFERTVLYLDYLKYFASSVKKDIKGLWKLNNEYYRSRNDEISKKWAVELDLSLDLFYDDKLIKGYSSHPISIPLRTTISTF